jgi:GDP-D-mannose dehydratase
MLLESPQDFILANESTFSVLDFASVAFQYFFGRDADEFIVEDISFFKPQEYVYTADTTKARKILEWEHTPDITNLIRDMVGEDLYV